MQITIHRPTQIGGQITCISTSSTKIIIDLGHNLPSKNGKKDALANHNAVAGLTDGCSAILYTHYHGDHIGLFHYVPHNIPQYIGKVALEVLRRKYQELAFMPDKADALEVISNMCTFQEKEKLIFGDITVTPLFVSHSAYDAYMFLIEAEGKRILHTGDFRGHGYLSKGLLPTVRRYIGQVDVLIVEGTMLNRTNEQIMTESDLFRHATELMRNSKYVFVHCSSTDLERLASFKNANNQMHPRRALMADRYQKDVLNIFSGTAGKESSCFDFGKVYTYRSNSPNLIEWMINNGFTMFVRPKNIQLLDKILPKLQEKDQILFIYSMWSGYITSPDTMIDGYIKLQQKFEKIEKLHTSGHATIDILCKICELTNPRYAIIPIHRDVNTDFKSIGIPARLQEKIIVESCKIDNIEIELLKTNLCE